MKLTAIKIKNVLGVRAADIAITTPVTLIAGHNASGKSCVQEAVRMALVGETVRVALKKDYVRLVTDGADHGLVEVGIAGGPVVWFSVPDGKRTPLTEYVAFAALPYILDAQRFARLDENDRRAFLFGLMGLSAGGTAVRERLLARGCDTAKIEAAMPLLRAGFAAACEEAKGKARDAKASWRTVTGETYGEKKAETWKANRPTYDAAMLAKTREQLKETEAAIEAAAATMGDLAGREKRYQDGIGKLTDLREKAGRYARIADKLAKDEAELKAWEAKVEETWALANDAAVDKPLTCPHCAGLVVHRPNMIGGELQPYQQPEHARDPEAAARLPDHIRARDLMARCVENGRRDLAVADDAAKQLRAIEEAGVSEPPDANEIEAAQTRLAALKHEKANHEAGIRMAEEAERQATAADKKTADASRHHADVEAWAKIADALAPDGIPGEMLAEALTPINARLAQSAADTGWGTVRIDAGMGIFLGIGPCDTVRHYALLSESEKWRADAMIAEAVAHLSGLKLLMLDRIDVLDLQGRADLIAWLDILATDGEIDTAIIFGTLKALPAQLPATVCAHWIEAGVVGGIKQAA